VNYKNISAVILAAGESSRLGTPKQLIPWRGMTLLTYTIQQIEDAGINDIVVVLGAFAEKIKKTINNEQLRIVINNQWASGKASTIRTGINAVPKDKQAAVIFLCDQPYLSSDLIRTVIENGESALEADIIAPRVKSQICNPVLFKRTTFNAFNALQGEEGGKQLFSRFKMQTFLWQDERILLDVDTVDDLKNMN